MPVRRWLKMGRSCSVGGLGFCRGFLDRRRARRVGRRGAPPASYSSALPITFKVAAKKGSWALLQTRGGFRSSDRPLLWEQEYANGYDAHARRGFMRSRTCGRCRRTGRVRPYRWGRRTGGDQDGVPGRGYASASIRRCRLTVAFSSVWLTALFMLRPARQRPVAARRHARIPVHGLQDGVCVRLSERQARFRRSMLADGKNRDDEDPLGRSCWSSINPESVRRNLGGLMIHGRECWGRLPHARARLYLRVQPVRSASSWGNGNE